MSICIFTKKDAFSKEKGSIVQAVKIADFTQKFFKTSESKKSQEEPVIILVEDAETKEIAEHFIKAINPQLQVKTISEFKSEEHKINCFIEAGSLRFFASEKEFPSAFEEPQSTPYIISMPDYGYYSVDSKRKAEVEKLYGGFNKEGYLGVIPNTDLLEATAGGRISANVLQTAYEQLDEKIKLFMGNDFTSFQVNREKREFTYQYSHDYMKYLVQTESNSDPASYTSVDFFLHELIMTDSTKSQDALCIGDDPQKKLNALTKIKDELITKGYTKISFVNIDDQMEQIIHEDGANKENKEFRVLYSTFVSYETIQALPLITTTDLVGATGDHSFVDAMSAKKLVSYECLEHKLFFVENYMEAVREKVSEMDLVGTSSEDVVSLAAFLIKPFGRIGWIDYKPEEVKRLLGNQYTRDALKNVNWQLAEESIYLKQLEVILSEDVRYLVETGQREQRTLAESLKKINERSEPWNRPSVEKTHSPIPLKQPSSTESTNFHSAKQKLQRRKDSVSTEKREEQLNQNLKTSSPIHEQTKVEVSKIDTPVPTEIPSGKTTSKSPSHLDQSKQCAVYVKKLFTTTKKYQDSLPKEGNEDIHLILEELMTRLDAPNAEKDPKTLENFYLFLDAHNDKNKCNNLQVIKNNKDPSTLCFIAGITLIVATLLTGILPGLIAIGIVCALTKKSPLSLFQPLNAKFVKTAEQIDKELGAQSNTADEPGDSPLLK